MGVFSILPESWRLAELWISRIFLLGAVVIIGPWLAIIVYDILLYICRMAIHGIPYVGGRARGQQRPRAPSLTERPSGHRRRLSVLSQARNDQATAAEAASTRQRATEDNAPRVPSRLRD
ncbi:hypothetical protein CERZMDRAFT_49930 [Cercospora zeae-maydis SCOH1-5]|uniref:Uncharacterized protein n=1 Tax=Cercospora zeae-maydis SCOH1-5 TaxID=717836 RepID=A0A6A6F2W0_9PEZI|nr:hypothetical protein CERZMDRAFT_49930 [Cercospora zeae-maydis SCOH1-5]